MTDNKLTFSTYNNATCAMIGMTTLAFSQWGFVILISKHLGPVDVGNYALGMAIINPVFALFSFQFRAHFATKSDNRFKLKDYLYLRILLLPLILSLSLALSLFVKPDLMFFFLCVILTFAKCSDFISDIFYAAFQRNKELRLTAISQIFRGLGGLSLFSIVLFLSRNICISFIFVVLVWLIVLIYFDKNKAKSIGYDFNYSDSKLNFGLIKETWPMALAVLLSSLSMNVPRYLISLELGEVALGKFASQAYFLTFFCMFSVSIAQSISRALADNVQTSPFHFFRLLGFSTLAIFVISFILYAISKYYGNHIVGIIYSNDFRTNSQLLNLIMLSCAFWGASNILDYGLIALRVLRFRPVIILCSIVTILVTWTVSYPKHGIDTGGYSLLAGGICQFSFYLILLFIYRPQKTRFCLKRNR